MIEYEYYINLDERGEFYADVRDPETDDSVFEIADIDHLNELVEDGFIDNGHDITGIQEYLIDMEIINPDDTITEAN